MTGIRVGNVGRARLLGLLLAWLLSTSALAHKPSDSYLTITGGGEYLTAKWDISLKDLEYLIGLDADQNGEITWGELKVKRQAITAHALSRLRITADGTDCDLKVTQLLVTRHSDGTYAVLELQTDCPGDAAVLNIHYNLLFDADPTHRGLVLYTGGAVARTHVLSPSVPTLELRTGEIRLWQSFMDYVREGIWHIWIGFDHIFSTTFCFCSPCCCPPYWCFAPGNGFPWKLFIQHGCRC